MGVSFLRNIEFFLIGNGRIVLDVLLVGVSSVQI
jgi:hypothetical protein